jgi:tRNA-splicing ligase RtcB
MSKYEIRNNGTGVIIHAGIIEDMAKEQIDLIVSHPAIRGLVAIMPDVHAGAGCVVGFTGQFKNAVIPEIVGVDLGCGVLTVRLNCKEIDFAKLDDYIRKNIPTGFKSRSLDWIDTQGFFDKLPMKLRQQIYDVSSRADVFLKSNAIKSKTLPSQQMGTLGGGNHFIEIEKGSDGELYLTIHSGSRNFGLKVADFYQNMAMTIVKEMNINVPRGLEYLPLSYGGLSYLLTAKLAQDYAFCNRMAMMHTILRFLGEDRDDDLEEDRIIESVHNYISTRDGIIRKGAISAHKDEKLVIPLNMGAGIVIGKGKGNKDYNWSAPHGAGRLYGRKDMIRRLDSGKFYSMEAFEDSMKGIFTTSISRNTFDESPFAYKPWDSISSYLEETVDIEQVAKPVYNLKASGEEIRNI